uniref:Uncharacterized protein n=1 Tax=Rhizophora mucronata TaxID=61149 RepID=A0A2P2PDB0_RHIMU
MVVLMRGRMASFYRSSRAGALLNIWKKKMEEMSQQKGFQSRRKQLSIFSCYLCISYDIIEFMGGTKVTM